MIRVLRDWLRAATDVRREEYLPAGLMFVYGFLAMTSYYIAKSVRNAVFVQRVGADNLDYVYILTAVVVTAVMVVYSRYVDRLKEMTLLQGTFALLGVTMVGFAWLLRDSSNVLLSGGFYLFIKLYPLLLVSQFWLVGNLLFTTRQAKRLFGPVGVGLIVGAITGGTIASQAVEAVGSENLLYLAAGILVLCAGVVWTLGPRLEGDRGASARLVEELSGDALQLLKDSDHLRTIGWILGLTILASTVIDWQLNKAVELFVQGEDAMTAFWGEFFVWQNVASVAVQVLFTGYVLRKFGIGVAMLFLPVGLLAASAGVLVVPALLTAALAKGTEGALRYSLDQSTRELLYLPVPTEVKYKTKPLIDMAVYRLGTGVGGVVVLIFSDGLGLSFRWMAVVVMAIVAAWIGHTLRMRGEFRSSIKRLIGVRDVDLEELIYQRLDARTLEELGSTLREGDEEEILYALALLEHNPPEELLDDLKRLLRHTSGRVRARALDLLFDVGGEELVADVEPLLEDSALDVRVEAINYICRFSSMPAGDRMDVFLRDEDDEVRTAAMACLIRHGNEEQVDLGRASARGLAADPEPAFRRDAARILGELEEVDEESEPLLLELLRDEDEEVRHEAMRAAGRTGSEGAVPILLDVLETPPDRGEALAALHRYGSEIHDMVLDHVAAGDVSPTLRRQLPALLVSDARQEDADRMVGMLEKVGSATVRFHLLKALNKLRRKRADLDFSRHDLFPAVRREIRAGYRFAAWYAALLNGDEETSLLLRTLEQRRREAVERALRILGLQHPQEDLYVAFRALSSSDTVMQQRGFELLDNVLPRRVRQLFDPLANPDESPRRRARAAREQFGLRRPDRRRALSRLGRNRDLWLAVLARLEAGEPPLPEGRTTEEFRQHLLADTVLGARRATPSGHEVEIMDIVERADFLRRTRIFSQLRTEDLAGLAALTEERRYGRGEVLFPEGSAESALYVVVQGKVEARRDGRVAREAGPAETVGDLALLDGRPTHYEAVAGEDTRALRLSREDFYNLMEDRFRVAREVMAYLAGVLREAEPAAVAGPASEVTST